MQTMLIECDWHENVLIMSIYYVMNSYETYPNIQQVLGSSEGLPPSFDNDYNKIKIWKFNTV